jgi:hypothetical protein
MRLISHRGNINGPQPDLENSPSYIMNAASNGYEVEIDVWFHKSKWYLGHDEPTYPITSSFFHTGKFWLHAKSPESLSELAAKGVDLNYFWHENDRIALTSINFLWTCDKDLPAKQRAVLMIPNKTLCDSFDVRNKTPWDCPEGPLHYAVNHWDGFMGVCNDYIDTYKEYNHTHGIENGRRQANVKGSLLSATLGPVFAFNTGETLLKV